MKEDLITLILKEFEKRNLSINQARAILNEISFSLELNSTVSVKEDQ